MPMYRRRNFILSVSLALIQQGLLAFSTFSLIQASQSAVETQLHELIHWGSLFLACVLLAYPISLFSKTFLSYSWFDRLKTHIEVFSSNFSGKLALWNNKSERKEREPWLTHEGWITLTEYQNFKLDFVHLSASVLFNLVVIIGFLDMAFIFVTVLSLACHFLLICILPKRVSKATAAFQDQRNELFGALGALWEHSLLKNLYNSQIYNRFLWNHFNHTKKAAVSSTIWTEISMILPMSAGLLVLFLWLFFWGFQQDLLIVIALLATLPRQIQILQYSSELTGYLILWPSWKKRLQQLKDKSTYTEPESLATMHWSQIQIDYNSQERIFPSLVEFLESLLNQSSVGRWTIRGPNGCGKTTLLHHLKIALGERALLLPTQHQLHFENQPRAASTGQLLLVQIQELMEKSEESFILLDEWDANLDSHHKKLLDGWLENLSKKKVIIEVSHQKPLEK